MKDRRVRKAGSSGAGFRRAVFGLCPALDLLYDCRRSWRPKLLRTQKLRLV